MKAHFRKSALLCCIFFSATLFLPLWVMGTGCDGFSASMQNMKVDDCTGELCFTADMNASGMHGTCHWIVDFGDGETFETTTGGSDFVSKTFNLCHTYSAAGTYTVTFSVTPAHTSCEKQFQITIPPLTPAPVPDFSVSNVCLYETAQFTDESSIPGNADIIAWKWDFGDGTVSFQQNPSHQYASPGVYDVTLKVTADNGCQGITSPSQKVTVHPVPDAAFSTDNICLYDTAQFSNTSSISSGNINNHQWDFGDGVSSSQKNPKHHYTFPGTYSVTLVEISNKGCRDSVTDQITIFPVPVAGFTFSNVCLYDPVEFQNTSTIASGNFSQDWDFSDGTTSTAVNPDHQYSSPGVYDVRLIVTSNKGCSDTMELPVTVYPVPVASFTADSVCLGTPTTFTNISTLAGDSISSYEWNFGDGGNSGLQHPSYLFSSDSAHHVTLIVTSDKGCTDTSMREVIVHSIPFASFTAAPVCHHFLTVFENNSSIDTANGDSINVYLWNFGNGSGVTSVQHPVHEYLSPGTWNVALIVQSNFNCIHDTVIQVIVFPQPEAEFTNNTVCLNEPPVKFTNASTISSGNIVTWDWNFGDGSPSGSQQNPGHVYASHGTFMVQLTVTSDQGCKDSIEHPVTVHPAPQASFAADILNGCQTLCVNFADTSAIAEGAIVSWDWISVASGALTTDGMGETELVEVCYEDTGLYSIRLIITSDKGCKDTLVKNDYIEVYPLPVADFDFAPQPTTVQHMKIAFTDFSSGYLAQWNWIFYDNDSSRVKGTSYLQHPYFDFATDTNNKYIYFIEDSGEYPVQLIVTTIHGCKDTIIKTVKIDPVFYINTPNAFTPGRKDGINDDFFPVGIGFYPARDYTLYIFDRWGDLIFVSHSVDDPWDGTAREQGGTTLVQQDVYVWMLEVRDVTVEHKKHNYIGHVSVVK